MTKRMGLKPQGDRVVKGEWRERSHCGDRCGGGRAGRDGAVGGRGTETSHGGQVGPGAPGGRCQAEEAAAGQSGPVHPEGGGRSPAARNSGVMGVKESPLSRTPLEKGKQGQREVD